MDIEKIKQALHIDGKSHPLLITIVFANQVATVHKHSAQWKIADIDFDASGHPILISSGSGQLDDDAMIYLLDNYCK